jgi:ethanolamine utilization protein EutN
LVIGKVIKRVVSTVKNKDYLKHKLLLVQTTSIKKTKRERPFLAIDLVQAGEGDEVLVVREGGSARMSIKNDRAPVRSVIVGIIDNIDIEK